MFATNIKYGCFCHLYHSFYQVTRVSDVLSIGQKLTLRCIGQDVRGNIKLSLKATLPRPGSDGDNVSEALFASLKEAPKYSASYEDMFNEPEKHSGTSGTSEELLVNKNEVSGIDAAISSIPQILIRSAAACDEEEKSAGLTRNSKSKSSSADESENEEKSAGLTRNSKRKSRNAAESEEEEKSAGLTRNSKSKSSASEGDRKLKRLSRKIGEKESNSMFKSQNGDDIKQSIASLVCKRSDSEAETETEAPVTAKSLKLGTKVTAKVYQVRARGLVLDLGGGLRGMYRFEVCPLHYNIKILCGLYTYIYIYIYSFSLNK